MKLTSIFAENLLGVKRVDVTLDTPVTLFCGRNGAGKSSLRDGVALALIADLSRVELKKDAGELVRVDAKAAVCEVNIADGRRFGVSITKAGKITNSAKGVAVDPRLHLVLDAQRFARMDDKERRSFLFDLMNVAYTPQAIAKRLLEAKLDNDKVENVTPLLRSGFEAACNHVKTYASEARGAWKNTTGEAYGREKAKTWRATAPVVDGSVMPTLDTKLKHVNAAIDKWQEAVGALQAELGRRDALAATLSPLKLQADRLAQIEAKLKADEAEHARIDTELGDARTAAGGGPRMGLIHDLAAALHLALEDLRKSKLGAPGIAYSALADYAEKYGAVDAPQGDPEATARIPRLEQALALMVSALANDRRDHTAAAQAAAALATARQELLEPFDQPALDEALGQVSALKAERETLRTQHDAVKSAVQAADHADRKTQEARRHHRDVEQWEAIANALAPDGIPSELLAEALGPINERLMQSGLDAGWPIVCIDADMSIRAGHRARHLMSVSEQYRCDAMIAEAVSHLSKLRLIVLDGADVLDVPARNDLLGWLDVLAEIDEIDTALVFATLTYLPADLPPTITARWMADGVLAEPPAAPAPWPNVDTPQHATPTTEDATA